MDTEIKIEALCKLVAYIAERYIGENNIKRNEELQELLKIIKE